MRTEIQNLKRRIQKYKQLCLFDELTNLYNRRKLFRDLSHCIEVVKRYNTPFVISFLDINKFKQINDKFGHYKGDKVLKYLGSVLKQTVRKVDKCYRYGGDEFVILFHGTNNCDSIIDRIRKELKKKNIYIAIGTLVLKSKYSAETILSSLDEKMYKDKKRG